MIQTIRIWWCSLRGRHHPEPVFFAIENGPEFDTGIIFCLNCGEVKP